MTTYERFDYPPADLEASLDGVHLANQRVDSISWEGIGVRVRDKISKSEKSILYDVSGEVKAGELVAIMGPSGSGKTTLLNVLAHRPVAPNAAISGDVYINSTHASLGLIRQVSCYVEQEDHLIGSLTARETLDFAAQLSLPSAVTKADRRRRVDGLLAAFGLTDAANTIVGTPVRKGLSGGQKRRLSIAAQLIAGPNVLFLDEPTSGLDYVASHEVMSYLRAVTARTKIIVIASIHQPSASTFALFDKLLLLSRGGLCYAGPLSNIAPHFAALSYPLPPNTSTAESLLELVDVDFSRDRASADARVQTLNAAWRASRESRSIGSKPDLGGQALLVPRQSKANPLAVPFILLHRNWIKSYRDIIAYGIRVAMYLGLAIMMGTVWLRLSTDQDDIQPLINSIFFGSAFMSFMAVAYVPAFLEDRATFVKERANGLYGPTSFMIANFLIGLPYLLLISTIFSLVTYFLCNFRPASGGFFTYLGWLFADLIAAESLVVLVSSAFPIFVVALALVAFANGLWMSVGGFLVSPKVLNVFWRTWARHIDYQAYVFQGMMVNEFAHRTYTCGKDCQCMYQTPLADQCKIAGQGVLDKYGYEPGHTGEWVGILIAIIVVYRLLGWLVLTLRKT